MTSPLSLGDSLAAAFAHLDAGRVEESGRLARLIEKQRANLPGLAYLYGLIALEEGEPAKAARHLAQALKESPDTPPLLLAMARAQSRQKRESEAEIYYRHLLKLAPDAEAGRVELAAVLLNRGMARRDAGAPQEAEAMFMEAATLNPRSVLAPSLLGRLYESVSDKERAIAWHRRALELDPTDRYGAAISLAKLGAGPVPNKATDAFLRGLFDEYSEKFDAELTVMLRYRAPELLAGAIRRALGNGPFDIFDAGCGTGLMGVALEKVANRLDGADLSLRMVERAEARHIYDDLAVGDVVELLTAKSHSYDLVAAADVLVYIGDLEPIYRAVVRALRPGGGFAFSVERDAGDKWGLGETGRFTHSAAYLRALAEEYSFEVAVLEEDSTREDRGVPVPGLICVLRKPK